MSSIGGVQQSMIGRIANSTGMDQGAVNGIFDPVMGKDLIKNASALAGNFTTPGLFIAPEAHPPGPANIAATPPFPGSLTDFSHISQQTLSGMSNALGKINDGLSKMGVVIEDRPAPTGELLNQGIIADNRPSPTDELSHRGIIADNRPSPTDELSSKGIIIITGKEFDKTLGTINNMTSLLSNLSDFNLSLDAARIIGDIGLR